MLDEIAIDGDYFDPDFHIFYEDLDIAWRAQRFGWKGYYNPKAVAYHVRGATVRKPCGIDRPYAASYLDDALLLDLIKNRYLVIIKNESFPNFILHLPFLCLYDALIFGYILFFKPRMFRNMPSILRYMKNAFMKRDLSLLYKLAKTK